MSKLTQNNEWEKILLKKSLSRLSKLEQYYIGIPEQKKIYQVTLEELRTLYRNDKLLFSEGQIKLITAIKNRIEKCPDLKILKNDTPGSTELINGNIVFHRIEFYVGQLDGTTDMKELFEDPSK